MTITTGADLATWIAGQGMTSIQAAPILGISHRTIDGSISSAIVFTAADAARINAGIALYVASPSTYPPPCE